MKNQSKKLLTKIQNYEKSLKEKNENKTECISPAGDKKRFFNVITIQKDKNADVILSLSIEFLFFLKEVGNKFSHFDQSVLNYILYNDLVLLEENKMENKNINILEDEIKLKKIEETIKIDNSDNIIKKDDNKELKLINSKNQINNEERNKNQIRKIKASLTEPKLNENKAIKRVEGEKIQKIKGEDIKSKSTESQKKETKLNKNEAMKKEILKFLIPKNTRKQINEKIKYYKLKNLNNDSPTNKNKLKSISPKKSDKNNINYDKNKKIRTKSLGLKKSDKIINEEEIKISKSVELEKSYKEINDYKIRKIKPQSMAAKMLEKKLLMLKLKKI